MPMRVWTAGLDQICPHWGCPAQEWQDADPGFWRR